MQKREQTAVAKAPAQSKSGKTGDTRGSRLPDDWVPARALAEYRDLAPHVRPEAELDQFRDYWAGVAGSKGVKRNWEATWRNWLREAEKRACRWMGVAKTRSDGRMWDPTPRDQFGGAGRKSPRETFSATQTPPWGEIDPKPRAANSGALGSLLDGFEW